MSAESNVEFVKALLAAFGRGDIDHFIDAHADDAVTESPVSHSSTLPWAGVRHGRQELVEHFETIVAHVRPEPFHDVTFTAKEGCIEVSLLTCCKVDFFEGHLRCSSR